MTHHVSSLVKLHHEPSMAYINILTQTCLSRHFLHCSNPITIQHEYESAGNVHARFLGCISIMTIYKSKKEKPTTCVLNMFHHHILVHAHVDKINCMRKLISTMISDHVFTIFSPMVHRWGKQPLSWLCWDPILRWQSFWPAKEQQSTLVIQWVCHPMFSIFSSEESDLFKSHWSPLTSVRFVQFSNE